MSSMNFTVRCSAVETNLFRLKQTTFLVLYDRIKGVVYDSNPKHFLSNSENISSWSSSFLFCVYAEKKVGCSYIQINRVA